MSDLKLVVRRASAILARPQGVLTRAAIQRLRCLLPMLLESHIDDRFITYDFLVSGAIRPLTTVQIRTLMRRVKPHLLTHLTPERTDRQWLDDLRRLDDLIYKNGMALINLHVRTRAGIADPAKRQIHDWMATQQRRRNSIYSCYGGERNYHGLEILAV